MELHSWVGNPGFPHHRSATGSQPLVTVLEPASNSLLVDLGTVKDELGISSTDTTQDARLSRYIAQASSQIHAFARRVFPVQTYRNSFRKGSWCVDLDALTLSETPVIEIVGIEEDGTRLDAAYYQLDVNSGIVARLMSGTYRVCWPAAETVIDFRAGYSTVPYDVQSAALLLIRLRQGLRGWNATTPRDPALKAREADTYGRMEFFGNVMPNTIGGLPSDIAGMLEHYVRPVLA